MFRRKARNPAQRMRFAVDAMPRRSREAMLRGIEANPIIAGGYTDRDSGGICPMLAAHRNGGRTSLASFARSWDRFTGARRPRLATARELRALRTYLEMSLSREEIGEESLVTAAKRIRAERAELAPDQPRARTRRRPEAGDRDRSRELRRRQRWAWILPARRYDVYRERVAAASEQLGEQRADELLSAPVQGAAAERAPQG